MVSVIYDRTCLEDMSLDYGSIPAIAHDEGPSPVSQETRLARLARDEEGPVSSCARLLSKARSLWYEKVCKEKNSKPASPSTNLSPQGGTFGEEEDVDLREAQRSSKN